MSHPAMEYAVESDPGKWGADGVTYDDYEDAVLAALRSAKSRGAEGPRILARRLGGEWTVAYRPENRMYPGPLKER